MTKKPISKLKTYIPFEMLKKAKKKGLTKSKN